MNGILAAVSQREFLTAGQIKEFVRQHDEKLQQDLYGRKANANPAILPHDLRVILIFIEEKLQTWLVADSMTAYCVLDDRRREEPRVRLTTSLADALPVQVEEIRVGTWAAKAGVLHFGNNPSEWMYSKNLFAYEDVQATVTRFLSDNDGCPAQTAAPQAPQPAPVRDTSDRR
ncbi:MAG: hypothetical protein JWQ55_7004 [Rhodopila sp.]|jgi:hypothetical protein|nr:hypothetical protein [Rhodopila sp.]